MHNKLEEDFKEKEKEWMQKIKKYEEKDNDFETSRIEHD